jgi:hypothetical protein
MSINTILSGITGIADGGRNTASEFRTLLTDMTQSLSASTDDYLSGATFNTADGVLTLTKHSGGTVTVDLDGRYLESSGFTYDNGYILAGDGTKFNSVLMSGDASIASDGTVTINSGGADSIIQVGKVNEAGGITKGQVVTISGASGGFPEVELADNTDFTKADVLAVAAETKSNNQNINVVTNGLLENVDTSNFTEGDVLYLYTGGTITNVHPSGINAIQRIGHAVKINASTGSILVELDGLTVIANSNSIVRQQIVNLSSGTSASVAYTLVNEANQRSSISMVGSNFTAVPGIASSLVLYNEGYNNTFNVVDGNFGFDWWTDEGDSHNLASTSKMNLSASGNLTLISGNTTAQTVITSGYTVSTLPSGEIGMRTYVTDAVTPTYLGALSGGGAVIAPVFYNGVAWVSA